MSITAVGLVVLSGILHALWNLLTKQSRDRLAFLWWVLLIGCGMYLVPTLRWGEVQGFTPAALPWAMAGGFCQAIYCLLLAAAYRHGDLSLVYPLSRGTAPIFIVLWATSFQGERVAPLGGLGIAAIVVGVYLMHLHCLTAEELLKPLRAWRDRATQLALLLGVSISLYHVIDNRGVELAPPFAYFYLMECFVLLFLSGFIVFLRSWAQLRAEVRANWRAIAFVAVFYFLTYLLILFALTEAQVSYVGPARNVSVVVATLFGVAILREPAATPRLLGSTLILSGLVLLAASP
ncbi:MAG TPA: hypothetical protein EYP85_12185 [Armatimonadetes bacterium]|nr:hypothetical protein [Armatimonadota bacterium]